MKSFEVMSKAAQKDAAAHTSEYLIPLSVLETFAKLDRPMTVAAMRKTLNIETATLQPHFRAMAEHAFIQGSGFQSTLETGRRLAVLFAALEASDLTWRPDPQALACNLRSP